MSKNNTDRSITNGSFFNDLTDVGKGFFLALRESYISFVDEQYINRDTLRIIDNTAQKFTEQINPDILNITATLTKMQAEIDQLKISSAPGNRNGTGLGNNSLEQN